MSKKVFVGLSGGVDSSVSAALLKQQGYDVFGVYMKNWSKAIGGVECPWQEDYHDAKRVAAYLSIPFEMIDFETEYFDRVVRYMLDAFRSGLTPNPDVMCNQEIKFKLFLDACLDRGADYIATGHYAKTNQGHLLLAKDGNKDQTYFLYRTERDALKKTMFPVGDYTKPEIRNMAKEFGLPTATKKESMGICFVGKVGIKEFLKTYVNDYRPGPVVDQNGAIIGEHEGAIFYTIGQRSGLGIGGGLPYYVSGKDMESNTVYVSSDIDDSRLWSDNLRLESVHWINKADPVYVRNRHRSAMVRVESINHEGNTMNIKLSEKVRAITPGQSTVFYTEAECLGGGIVSIAS